MNTKNMQAQLLFTPVDIKKIFFSDMSFKVHQAQEADFSYLEKNVGFSSSIAILNKDEKRVQVNVRFFTVNHSNDKIPIEFMFSCIGIYQWIGNTFSEQEIKNIYSWGVSIQTSTIRQKIAQEMSNSPYHEAWYLPLALVKIEDNAV